MSKTHTIVSTMHTALRISASPDNPEKPGEAGVLDRFVLNPGRNDGVPADLYDAWAETHKFHPAVVGGLLRVAKDEAEAEPSYGYEPALEALSKDKDNTKIAKGGVGEADEPGDPVPVTAATTVAGAPTTDAVTGGRGKTAKPS